MMNEIKSEPGASSRLPSLFPPSTLPKTTTAGSMGSRKVEQKPSSKTIILPRERLKGATALSEVPSSIDTKHIEISSSNLVRNNEVLTQKKEGFQHLFNAATEQGKKAQTSTIPSDQKLGKKYSLLANYWEQAIPVLERGEELNATITASFEHEQQQITTTTPRDDTLSSFAFPGYDHRSLMSHEYLVETGRQVTKELIDTANLLESRKPKNIYDIKKENVLSWKTVLDHLSESITHTSNMIAHRKDFIEAHQQGNQMQAANSLKNFLVEKNLALQSRYRAQEARHNLSVSKQPLGKKLITENLTKVINFRDYAFTAYQTGEHQTTEYWNKAAEFAEEAAKYPTAGDFDLHKQLDLASYSYQNAARWSHNAYRSATQQEQETCQNMAAAYADLAALHEKSADNYQKRNKGQAELADQQAKKISNELASRDQRLRNLLTKPTIQQGTIQDKSRIPPANEEQNEAPLSTTAAMDSLPAIRADGNESNKSQERQKIFDSQIPGEKLTAPIDPTEFV